METTDGTSRLFRCPRCQHTGLESVPRRSQCPQCGQEIPRPEEESFRKRQLTLRQMEM